MAVPLLLIPSIITIIGGGAAGAYGGKKMNNAGQLMEEVNSLHERNLDRFRAQNYETCINMDRMGVLELSVLTSFEKFSKLFEKIRDKPEFRYNCESGVSLPEFNPEKIKKVSEGAVILISLLKGGAAGIAGGFITAGGVPAAIMASGNTAAGVAIASLKGQAAVNAMLAKLGGGSIAAGGGGMVLGKLVLNVATVGVAMLIGAIIFNISASSCYNAAEEAWEQVKLEEASVDRICGYLEDLNESSKKYHDALNKVRHIYNKQLRKLSYTVNVLQKTNHHNFTTEETINLQNTILLVQLLHEMCKVKLVLKNETEDDINTVNHLDINKSIVDSEKVLKTLPLPSYSSEDEDDFDKRIKELTAELDAKKYSYE